MADKSSTPEPVSNPYRPPLAAPEPAPKDGRPPLSVWLQIGTLVIIGFFGGAVILNLLCVIAKQLWPNALRTIAPGDFLHNAIFVVLAAAGFVIRRSGRRASTQP